AMKCPLRKELGSSDPARAIQRVKKQYKGHSRNGKNRRQRSQAENAPYTEDKFLHVGQVQREGESAQRAREQDPRRLRLLAIERREREQGNVAENPDQCDRNTGDGGVLAPVDDIAIKGLTEVAVGGFRFAEMMIERYRRNGNPDA